MTLKKLLVILFVLIVLIGGGYLALFERGKVARYSKGYRTADNPQQAAEMFKKAIENRDFDFATDYCTAGYAEQMLSSAEAANELAVALDNAHYQLKERDLARDEVKLVLLLLDPFPKEFTITIAKETAETAEATIKFASPLLKGNQPSAGTWKLKPEIFQAYTRSMYYVNPTTVVVPMKKEKNAWKFDFPSDTTLAARSTYLKDKYKNYVNPLKLITQEVKNDPTTKENITTRMKTLMEEAAQE